MKKTITPARIILIVCIAAAALAAAVYVQKSRQIRLLNEIIDRLSADSRIAEVMVTDVQRDPKTQTVRTTIKFLEYDTARNPLLPKYFTFSSDIIQFQSLVIRFDDYYVKKGHPLKGKSAYVFMKAFALHDSTAECHDINTVSQIPSGYQVAGSPLSLQQRLWQGFWDYALDPQRAKNEGIKNAQIEAPGTRFVPGILYTLKIEHDGGMRVDAQPLPKILEGEKIAVPSR